MFDALVAATRNRRSPWRYFVASLVVGAMALATAGGARPCEHPHAASATDGAPAHRHAAGHHSADGDGAHAAPAAAAHDDRRAPHDHEAPTPCDCAGDCCIPLAPALPSLAAAAPAPAPTARVAALAAPAVAPAPQTWRLPYALPPPGPSDA